jgi:hypothetical protein
MRRCCFLAVALLALLGGAVGCGPAPTARVVTVLVTEVVPAAPAATSAPGAPAGPASRVEDLGTLCLEARGDLAEQMASALPAFLGEPGMDLAVWAGREQACDAVLTVDLVAEPLGESYFPISYTPSPGEIPALSPLKQTCYNGAEVSGQMQLALPGCASAEVAIGHRIPPPEKIGACREKAKAPLQEAWPPAVLEGLAHFWGPRVWIQALARPDALPGAPGFVVQRAASEALKELSGEDFIVDADRWQAWWEGLAATATPFVLPRGTPSPTPTSTATPVPGGLTGLALYADGTPAAGLLLGLHRVTGEETRVGDEMEVRCAGTAHSATTDAGGRFRMEGVPPGRYLIDDATEYGLQTTFTGSCVLSAHPAVVDVAPGQVTDAGRITMEP